MSSSMSRPWIRRSIVMPHILWQEVVWMTLTVFEIGRMLTAHENPFMVNYMLIGASWIIFHPVRIVLGRELISWQTSAPGSFWERHVDVSLALPFGYKRWIKWMLYDLLFWPVAVPCFLMIERRKVSAITP